MFPSTSLPAECVKAKHGWCMKTVHCSPHTSTWQTIPKLTAHILNSYYSNESPGYVQSCKVNLSLCLTNEPLHPEGVWGSGCIDPHFLDLGTSWRWAVSFTPLLLYPRGKSPRYPLDRRLGGPQIWSGQHEGEKILDPTGTWTLTSQSSSQ
jgi:hypothetical protein